MAHCIHLAKEQQLLSHLGPQTPQLWAFEGVIAADLNSPWWNGRHIQPQSGWSLLKQPSAALLQCARLCPVSVLHMGSMTERDMLELSLTSCRAQAGSVEAAQQEGSASPVSA